MPKTDIQQSISKEEVNALPLYRFTGEYEVIDSQKALTKAMKTLEKETILGFDTETRPAFKKGQTYPTSLIQLAGEDTVFIIQVGELTDLQPLADLFGNKKIIKAGVAIHDDIRQLKELTKFKDLGFVEISDETGKLGIKNTGLRTLAGIFFGCRISKSHQVSNWAKKDLTKAQLAYAATDAKISRDLYIRVQQLLTNIEE